MLLLLVFIVVCLCGNALWLSLSSHSIDFKSEKDDILDGRQYLIEKIIVSPEDLLSAMPADISLAFQGESAMYSASMLAAALTNISKIYPMTRPDSIVQIDHLIKLAMSEELRYYDAERWGEDPLEALDENTGQISYISHLAWMISAYKSVGDDSKYDKLYGDLCETMSRRILMSPNLNLQTYPSECIYVSDMLVAIAALANYADQNAGKYRYVVDAWAREMKEKWIEQNSGMITSMIPAQDMCDKFTSVEGSYYAICCYYLTFVDEDFARDQYEKLKKYFWQCSWPAAGFKEYKDRKSTIGYNIEAGCIHLNLSPIATIFGLGAATFFGDQDTRNQILNTVITPRDSLTSKDDRYFMFTDITLVGEAITLAMRTAVPWA